MGPEGAVFGAPRSGRGLQSLSRGYDVTRRRRPEEGVIDVGARGFGMAIRG